MKRIITFITFIVVTFHIIAQGFSYVYNGVEFKGKITDGVACIKSFNHKTQEVTIPASIVHKGISYPVKSVNTFLNGVNYSTVYLTIEEGIEEIDKFCFNEFRKLVSVKLPNSIRHIGKNAFRDNRGMEFDMAGSIDETAIRNGQELFIKNANTFDLAATNKSSYDISSRRKETQDEIENKKQQDKENEALKAQLLEQAKLLRETEELLAEAAKQKEKEEKQREKDKEKERKSKKRSGGMKGAFKGLFGINESDDSPEIVTQQPQPQLIAAAPAPVIPELPPVDVDIDIPVVSTDKNNNTYCVIIANEKYEDVPEVEYAERDGEVFREYCIKTLGIPEKQVKSFINASYTDVKRALNWIETMADISGAESKVIFYYAGHGIPNEKDKTAYLIPTDGFPKDITTCFKLSDMYARLGNLKSKSVTVLLDACFSGVKRGSGQALVAARGVAIKPKTEAIPGNMVVFTATSDDETALAYKDKRHGMFTYFLLDHLKKTRGNASFGEMFQVLSTHVKKNSMLENDKLQTPSVNVSASMKPKWKKVQF